MPAIKPVPPKKINKITKNFATNYASIINGQRMILSNKRQNVFITIIARIADSEKRKTDQDPMKNHE